MRLIDADKLKKDCSFWNDRIARRMFDAIVDRQETIEVEPERKGHWERRGANIECSCCELMPHYDSSEPLYDYCPFCGARMEDRDG